MKRWLTCLVALVLALALLVPALAETEYPDYLNLESQDPIIKEGAEAPKPKWMIVQDSTAGKWEDLWICRYFRERYNIEFDVESILNTALSERKSLMFATGDLPDMMTGFGFSTAEILRYGQQEGMLLPMDEYFSETLTPNICKTLQDETIRATATTPDGMSLVTTLPAPITTSEPMVTPGHTITPMPNHTLSPTVMGSAYSRPSLRSAVSTGCPAVENTQLGAMNTLSPNVTGAPSKMTSPWLQ